MPKARPRAGKVVNYETPNWLALQQALGQRQRDRFTWRYEVLLTDGTHVQVYRHCDTRGYLHLGEDGRAFHYTERGLYAVSDLEMDIWHVLPTCRHWLELGGYEEEDFPITRQWENWGPADLNGGNDEQIAG